MKAHFRGTIAAPAWACAATAPVAQARRPSRPRRPYHPAPGLLPVFAKAFMRNAVHAPKRKAFASTVW
ncbi:hypothetical protein D8B29_15745 [Verminephrobacter eiseniae]|nr:hypothetical protein [Verminephrobacter eiseniae]MCW8180997.1 hypothetical protein [Verminephrobacter eiseniae]